MFDDIGNKIKTLAKVVCALGMIGSIIGGIVICLEAVNRHSDSSFALGVLVALVGCILSWISVFVLYGFGELVDKTSSIERMLSEGFSVNSNSFNDNVNNNDYKTNTVGMNEEIICPNCGMLNEIGDYYCKKCKSKLR